MRVLLFGTNKEFNDPNGSGISRYAYELSNNLVRLSKAQEEINIESANYPTLPLFSAGLSPFIFSILKFKYYNRYNIVHNIEPKPIFTINRKFILITTFHDLRPLLLPNLTKSDFRNMHTTLGFVLTVKPGMQIGLNSDYFIANSTQTQNELMSVGVNKKKIFVTNLGVDNRFLHDTYKKAKSNKAKFKIGYIGLIGENKNVRLAINAIKLLSQDTYYFEIYGKPEYGYEQLTEIAKKNKNICFAGFAPESKLVDIYDSFDVFVHPSLYEGFGLPILEAQARGLPVIIYKYGKIPKEVRKYCFEAESPEHMAQIIEELKENGYNEKERKRAMEYARSFTWEKTARETLGVYKKTSD